MNNKEFIKRIRAIGKQRGLAVTLDAKRGKGSHAKLTLGNRFTTVAIREHIRTGTLRAMCRQLGITIDDL